MVPGAFAGSAAGADDLVVRVQSGLDFTTDDATGIRLGIPPGSSKSPTTTTGRNWKARSGGSASTRCGSLIGPCNVKPTS